MPPSEQSNDEIDVELRPAAAVAQRFLALNTVVRRLALDADPLRDVSGDVFDLREWWRTEGLWEEATTEERDLLLMPAGEIGPDAFADLSLRAEGLATLGWALQIIDTLSPDDLFGVLATDDSIPRPWEKTARWISSHTLRPEAEIVFLREMVELWAWRYAIEPLRRTAKGRELMEIERSIREVTHEGTASGHLAAGKKGGFTLDGMPVTRMADDDVSQLELIQTERLAALNWICGYGDDWDSVPLDI